MKFLSIIVLGLLASTAFAAPMISEVVYVEAPTDTDKDGKLDLIYVSISRPASDKKLSSIYSISPYALGGTDGPMHEVDMDILPQDEKLAKGFSSYKGFMNLMRKSLKDYKTTPEFNAPKYAQVRAHSVGTGNSTGCPTVGDMSETLAAKSVIDWLNGRARAFGENGKEVKADWANGKVGITGTSYDGTLPIMVATTGVEGLKAIVPIAAISSWYDYYRANGLVVNPGGYIGEDADVLGLYIARRGACKKELQIITDTMGRENGDFTPFWQDRDYVKYVKNIKAATFIIHGQSDWNVKQKHAISLWENLEGVAPRRMFLHRGGHGSTYSHGVPAKLQAWFDHFLEDEENGIETGPQVEVELPDGTLVTQNQWPHEDSEVHKFYFSKTGMLTTTVGTISKMKIIDSGKTQKMDSLINKPTDINSARLAFLSSPLESAQLLSGTPKVNLSFAVLNRKAANLSVAVVEYDKNGKGKIITRGWADAQNYRDFSIGELLVPAQNYEISFNLEPKEYRFAKGSRVGVVIASTDYDFTLRPKSGTEIEFVLDENSSIELGLHP